MNIRRAIKITTIISLTIIIAAIMIQPVFGYSEGTALRIPAIGVDAPVVYVPIRDLPHGRTWDVGGLNMTVGYLEQTAWFGQGGNVVLGGHSELARGQADVFYQLDQLEVGTEIFVNVGGAEHRYIVQHVGRVDQHDISIVRPTGHEQLTIITCDLGSYNASNGTYNNRVVVIAVPG